MFYAKTSKNRNTRELGAHHLDTAVIGGIVNHKHFALHSLHRSLNGCECVLKKLTNVVVNDDDRKVHETTAD